MHRSFSIRTIVSLFALFSANGVCASELDEIVVTAQKREQSIQDVGISISALSGSDLRERGIDNIDGLADAVPNVQLFNLSGGGVPNVVIRGVGLQNFRINDTPTTGIYVDDVYQTSIAQVEATLFDLERVEVLKGPQGGLYGRNALSGAIQFVSKAPSFEQLQGHASIGYGRYERVEVEGAIGGPLSDTIAARFSGRVVQSGDTYFRSTTGNFDHGEVDRWAARTIVSFKPSDTFSADLKVHGGSDQSETALFHGVGVYEPGFPEFPFAGSNYTASAGLVLGVFCPEVLARQRAQGRCVLTTGDTPESLGINGIYDSASDVRSRLDTTWSGISLKGVWDLDEITVTSISAYDQYDYARFTDQDHVDLVQSDFIYRSDIEVWSQEFRLAYDKGGRFRGLAGIGYAKDTLDEDTRIMFPDGLFPFVFMTNSVDNPYEQDSTSLSIFGRGDWRLSDALTLALEGRYTTEEKSFTGGTFFNAPLNTFVSPQNGQTIFTDSEETFDAVSGKASLEWSASEDTLVFGSIGRGFKTGGFFGGFALSTAELEPYDNEYILAYEVGVKSDVMSDRARINGSLFYYDRTDVQLNASIETGGVTIDRLDNVGEISTFGAEVQTSFLISEGLSLNLDLGYVDTEIEKVLPGATFEDVVTDQAVSPVGRRVPLTPEFTMSFYVDWQFPLTEALQGGFQAGYRYQSEIDFKLVKSDEEEALLTEDGYGLARIGFTVGSDVTGWKVSARVDNAFDEEYRLVSRDVTHGGFYEIWGAPRTWLVEIAKSW